MSASTTTQRSRRIYQGVGAVLVTCATATALLLTANVADAVIVPRITLGTAARYSVLGNQTVTNTGPSVLNLSVGLSPGTSVTGFPPGGVVPPAVIDVNSGGASQAQSDLTAAYVEAANRPVDQITTADLADLTLEGGVYAGPDKSALLLSGPLVLDGAGNPDSVFIFQTDSTLTTASNSSVTLINGAQECNVYWQVLSSATLGTNSVFAGNILALQSVTVTTNVLVHGRALARSASVTLDSDVFTTPTCAGVTPPGDDTTPPTTAAPPTTTPSTTVAPGPGTTVAPTPTPPTTVPVATTLDLTQTGELPRTGTPIGGPLALAALALTLGAAAVYAGRSTKVQRR